MGIKETYTNSKTLKILGVGISMVVATLIAVLVASPSAMAVDDMSVNTHLKRGDARAYCGSNYSKGMVWISNESDNYYSETVNVGINDTSVPVQVRGALNTCKTVLDPRKENRAYADTVKSLTPTLTIHDTDANPATSLQFYRGNAPSQAAYAWTTKGSYLNATLNVGNAAPCTGVSGIVFGSVKVQIQRTLLWRFIEYNGSVRYVRGESGVEDISVTVRRSCPDVVKPKVHILGGDLFTIGKVSMSKNSFGGKTYGSWAEYGIIAKGTVTNMASGSGYVGGVTSSAMCPMSLLTFANATDSSCSPSALGNYTLAPTASSTAIVQHMRQLPNTDTISGNVVIDALDSRTVYYATGNISLSASSPIAKGKWVVIMADEYNVRINSSVRYYSGSLSSPSDIPQLVIVGKNITIDDSVERIDAWLIASGVHPHGKIKTCDAASVSEPFNLNTSVCNRPLVVN